MIHPQWLRRSSLLLLLALICLALQTTPKPTLAGELDPQKDAAALQHLTLSDTGLSFTLHTPTFNIDNTGWLTAAGLDARPNQSGVPDVPFYSTYIALPPAAEVQLTVSAAAPTHHTVPTLRPIPTGTLPVELFPSLANNQLEEGYVLDAAAYQQNSDIPGVLYTLSAPMYLRDIRLVRLDLYPLQYNPAQATLSHIPELTVVATFTGSEWAEARPAPSYQDNHLRMVENLVLNPTQARQWRSLPREMNSSSTPTALPVGQTAYKITVSQDGIHEVSYAALGLSGSHPPASIQMLHDGQSVAFTFINRGGSASFDHPDDAVRFYGWAFDGSRHDQQYVSHNIFWLWVGGTATNISNIASVNGQPVAPSFPESITAEQNNRFTSTFVPQELWAYNEPDAWYWDLWTKSSVPVTRTYSITTPHPVTSGSNITFTTEILSRGNFPHLVNSYLNYATYGSSHQGTLTWNNTRNVNIVGTAPVSALNNGSNQITIGTHGSGSSSRTYLLNRLTIDYQRQFIAVNDQLIFTYPTGSQQYNIQGYSQNNPANVLVWNITNPYQPITVTGTIISGSGPYTYSFGSSNPVHSRFIATTTANIINITPAEVNSYFVTNIDPASGQAEWLAVSYADFLPAANQLASHRQNTLYGGYQTHVVDIAHIINQYGYGLKTPTALHRYLAHALADWTIAPSYVLLVGDASADARGRWVGNGAPAYWDANQISYINTDMLIIDRYQGLIPTDHSFVLLAGNDILPDMAIGRLAVQSNAEAVTAVNKIIAYEQNHLAYLTNPTSYQWLGNILFAADEFDPSAGDFCFENEVTAGMIPTPFTVTEMCRGNGTGQYPSDALMQAAMKTAINNQGLSLLNYRGHGSIDNWSGTLLTTTTPDFWQNPGKPVVSLSMDCLDAHFIFPGFEGLGETIVGQPLGSTGNVGAAAHWSSTGLGLTHEHNYLARGFYEGLWDVGLTAIGDAINYGKLVYFQTNHHYSEMYSFTLHGDPAMQLFRPALSLNKTAQPTTIEPGDTVAFSLTVSNSGLYPSQLQVVDNLPTGLSYITHTATVSSSITINGSELTFTLEPPLGPGDSATITLTTILDPDYTGPGVIVNQATVTGTGLEGAPGNETDTASVIVLLPNNPGGLYLPLVVKSP